MFPNGMQRRFLDRDYARAREWDTTVNRHLEGVGFDPFEYRHERWLRAWRWVPDPPRPKKPEEGGGFWPATGQWEQVYNGGFSNWNTVRTFSRSRFPPYFVVQVWQRKNASEAWKLTHTKANWQKGEVLA
jgi:hypothetical protein